MDKDYLKDISDIKTMMDKSTRFISLSGLAGILAGSYALIGAFTANYILINYQNVDSGISLLPLSFLEYILVGIAMLVLILSIFSAYILTSRKAKRNGEHIWTTSTKRMLVNFMIPLLTGGAFCIILYQYGFIGFIAPCTLIFYGLSCVNASKYTLGDIRLLGIISIVIGLVATQFMGYGIFFWAFGFGIMHIVYGILMYQKYDK